MSKHLESIEADWGRRHAGKPLSIQIKNRVAGELLGEPNWKKLGKLIGVHDDQLRRANINPAHQDKIIEAINRRLPQGPRLTREAFEAWQTKASRPVAKFHEWLRVHRQMQRVQTGALKRADGVHQLELDRSVKILEFLRRSDLRNVMIVHQEGMLDGLRALAAYLAFKGIPRDPELSSRDLCYLHVGFDGVTNTRVTFPRMVQNLYEFYCLEPGASEPQRPLNAESLRERLTLVREKMSTHPAILILDGYRAPRGALPELRSLVSDDALAPLLRELLHPLLDSTKTPRDPGTFYENRILILADRKVRGLEAFAAESLELQHLPPQQIEQVLASRGRIHIERLKKLYGDERMKSDFAMALADTVMTLRRSKPGVDTSSTFHDLTGDPEEWYAELVTQLIEGGHLQALFALRLVALSDGGMRYSSLVRVLGQWAKLAQSGWPAEFKPRPLAFTDVEQSLAPLKPLLFHGRDEEIRGLDDLTEPFVFLDEEQADPSLTGNHRRFFFDLCSEKLREIVVRQLARMMPNEEMIALMHRLLAEEALRKQTHIMRHAEWRGAADVRYYRHLFQTIFHGYASLGGMNQLPRSSTVPCVLPEDPASAYRRLYAVFYRTLLEHTPHLDLTRSLGRDRLKTELLLLAMNADRQGLWKSLYIDNTDLAPRTSEYLQNSDEGAAAQANFRLALDQALTLARAAYESQALELAQKAQADASELLGSYRGKNLEDPLDNEKLRARKTSLDIQFQLSPTGHIEKVKSVLRDIGFDNEQLDAVKVIQEQYRDQNRPDPPRDLHVAAQRFVDTMCHGRTAENLANWSDMLCRLGEAQATESYRQSSFIPLIRYEAFRIFYIAERIRREAFDREPLGRSFVVNNHATRVFVRTALQLVRALGGLKLEFEPQSLEQWLPNQRYFITQARRHLDLLTRYSARYPSERTSILILEATFTRSVGGSETDGLLAALKLLEEAELLIFTTPDRPRVRRRLILERAKVFRALASSANAQTRERWWKLAAIDIVRLWRMTTSDAPGLRPDGLWELWIANQARALHGIALELASGPDRIGLHPDDWEELKAISERAPKRN